MAFDGGDQCAIGADGKLLDASKIIWYNDPDDATPLSAPPPTHSGSTNAGLSVPSTLHRSASSNSLASSASSANLDDFRSSHKPAVVVAAVRRTTRPHVPSSRLLDLQNSASVSNVSKRSLGKRKANSDVGSIDLDISNNNDSNIDSLSFKKLRLNNQSEGSEAGDGNEDEDKSDDDDEPPPLVDVESDDEEDDEDLDGDGEGDSDDEEDEGADDEEDNAEAIEEAYLRTKSLGDADRSAMNSKASKAERTRDTKCIFTPGELKKDGKTVHGHWCTLCKAAGISPTKCFFVGNVSTLRTHISRNDGHFVVYEAKCKKANIPIHPRAVPVKQKDPLVQTTLETKIQAKTPAAAPFTSAGLLDYIIELIVSEDDAFRLVDKGPFRRLLQYCRPSLAEKDIPHRTKVRTEILERVKVVESRLIEKFKSLPGQISFTFDTWTSKSNQPYLGITGHYIDAPADQPHKWELKSEQLAYTPLEGNHSGANIAKILMRTIERYQIRDKVGWFTADNASNNDTAMRALGEMLDPFERRWIPLERRVRCMEHAIHLCAGHFIADISPTSVSAIIKKMRKFRREQDIPESENDDEDGGDGDGDGESFFDAGDAIGKGLALVKQIRKSPQAIAFLKKMCQEVGIAALQLLGWIRTRWASLFDFLNRFRAMRKAISRFVQLADDSDEVPTLKNKKYSDFRLTPDEWKYLDLMHEALQEPANAQQSFSSSHYPSAWRTIPILEFLRESWANMSSHPKFSGDLSSALSSGVENLDKWYKRTDDTNVYFVCLALNPEYKTAYAECQWDKEFYDAGVAKLEALFDLYSEKLTNPSSTASKAAPMSNTSPQPENKPTFKQYGHSWMKAAVQARKDQDNGSTNPRAELSAYLAAPLEDNIEDVIGWWGIHSTQYPTLSRIARDYLAIQGSAVASERAFSSGALTATLRRNRLTPQMFEALQILKSAYRNGHLCAEREVFARMIEYLEVSLAADKEPDF